MSINKRRQTKLEENKLLQTPSRLLRTHSSLQLLVSEHFNYLCWLSSFSEFEYNGCLSDEIRPYFLLMSIKLLSALGCTRRHGALRDNYAYSFTATRKIPWSSENTKFPYLLRKTWSILCNLMNTNTHLVLTRALFNSLIFLRMLR
jgi:hypothetical protein